MIDIDQLRKINKAENIVVTAHGRKRMQERGIVLRDIMRVISSGESIEQYPDDSPFPSCLLLGATANGRFLHVVLGTDGAFIYLITAYFPDPGEWENDLKTRRESLS